MARKEALFRKIAEGFWVLADKLFGLCNFRFAPKVVQNWIPELFGANPASGRPKRPLKAAAPF